MPEFVSQAQRAAFHAAAKGRGRLGISRAVARQAVSEDRGGKLPKRAKKHKSKHNSDHGRHRTILEG